MQSIVGEVSEGTVVFLVIPREKCILTLNILLSRTIILTRLFRVIDDENEILIEEGPIALLKTGVSNRVCISDINIQKENFYRFQWCIDDKVIRTHRLRMDMNPKKLVFVSCDLPQADTQHSLWNNISAESPDLCCHIGDNIYGDSTYHSRALDYNSLYQDTWGRWEPLLLDTSHLMIPDDHDITDGYTYGHTGAAVERGLQAYVDYQEALVNNNDSGSGFIVKRIRHDTVLVMISRTFIPMSPLDKLKQLRKSLTGNVIIAFSSAPILIPDNFRGTIYKTVFGDEGWDNIALRELYDFCFELMEENSNTRIVLIGGDVHFGVQGTINKGFMSIPIFITSPISNQPTIVEKICAKSLNGTIHFHDYILNLESHARRNYLRLLFPEGKSRDISGELIWNHEKYPGSILTFTGELLHMIGI